MKHTAVARLALTLTALSLTGCGYTPLYQPLKDGQEKAANIVQVGPIETLNPERNVGTRRPAQRISELLRQSFPNTGQGMDTLKVSIQETSTELAIDTAATVERVSLTLGATVRLVSPQNRVLFKVILSSDAPYNVENNPYSTETGKVYARQTAADNLTRDIEQRIVLYYRQHPQHHPEIGTQPSGPAAVGAPGGGDEERSNDAVDPSPAAPQQQFQPAPTL